MLVLRYPHVFAWPLSPDTSSLYGWMFFALSANYPYVAWRGTRSDAVVSLIAFLVYDLILIGPFIADFATVEAEHLPSLVIYTAVLVYSALLSLVYLLAVARYRRIPRRGLSATPTRRNDHTASHPVICTIVSRCRRLSHTGIRYSIGR
jgi:hypothetical protein